MGHRSAWPATIEASDYLLVHGNAHTIDQQVSDVQALRTYAKPIVSTFGGTADQPQVYANIRSVTVVVQ